MRYGDQIVLTCSEQRESEVWGSTHSDSSYMYAGILYTHTHTHMHAHAHMYAHTRTCTHMHTHAHTHTHTHTHTRTHTHAGMTPWALQNWPPSWSQHSFVGCVVPRCRYAPGSLTCTTPVSKRGCLNDCCTSCAHKTGNTVEGTSGSNTASR